MSHSRLALVTFGLMMGLFLASLEVTVVSTALPTIVAQLGGFDIYSWVFSIYMLTSTTTVPIFGRLSDLYGRRPIYLFGILFFLAGSALCGQANNMGQLIFFRAVQGLGAGALMPMSFTIIGDIYTLDQRARMQGLFSGVWGISSIVGPLVGGFLVDQVSWRWIFYLNVPFGLLAGLLVWFVLPEPVTERKAHRIDIPGALLLTVGVLALLYALLQGGTAYAWSDIRVIGLLAFAAGTLLAFFLFEGRVAEPLIPLGIFKDRLFAVASGQGFLAAIALFGSFSYIPLYVQGVLGTSATQAGASLTPMVLGWVSGSILSGQLLLRIGLRLITIGGMIVMTLGAFLLTLLDRGPTELLVLVSMLFMGFGMGVNITAFLVTVQSRVSRAQMGIATSSLQFVRQIGSLLGVSLLGAVMVARLNSGLASLPEPVELDPRALLDRSHGASSPAAIDDTLQQLLAAALQDAFLLALVATVAALLVTLLTPRGTTREIAGDEPLERSPSPQQEEPAPAPYSPPLSRE